MRIGSYDIHPIDAGGFALDGGAMFGVVPRPLWEKTNPPDDRNRVTLATRALLLVSDSRRILVDTGNGTKCDDKFSAMYRINVRPDTISGALSAYGLTPSDITDVILTHLHFDHAGGATVKSGQTVTPAFPRAKYYVQKDHWETALHPTERDKASFSPADFLPLRESGVLELLDGEGELFPGIQLLLLHGHTRSLQVPLVSDGTTTLLFCSDLIPTASHIPLPWIMGYDLRPLVTLEEKRSILKTAVAERWTLMFEHDPCTEAVTVNEGEKGFTVGKRIALDLTLPEKP
jgi:glyoxylase-like metal-dependent hydrolase (beta-lactamase superfamily II)